MEKLKVTIDDKGKIEIWMDGCVIGGVRGIELYWEVGEAPYHKIEFISHAAKLERKYSMD
jgi:hypothetical protein